MNDQERLNRALERFREMSPEEQAEAISFMELIAPPRPKCMTEALKETFESLKEQDANVARIKTAAEAAEDVE